MRSLHATPAAVSASVEVPALAWYATPAPATVPILTAEPAAVPAPV